MNIQLYLVYIYSTLNKKKLLTQIIKIIPVTNTDQFVHIFIDNTDMILILIASIH